MADEVVGELFPENDMDLMQRAIVAWGDETFPKATPLTVASHLLSEAVELFFSVGGDAELAGDILLDALNKDHNSKRPEQETADVQHLVFHMGGMLNFSVQQETQKRFTRNQNLSWTRRNRLGFVEHDKVKHKEQAELDREHFERNKDAVQRLGGFGPYAPKDEGEGGGGDA